MDTLAKNVGLLVVAAVCGAAYVLVHERRRRYKKLHPRPNIHGFVLVWGLG